ncbi:hypothetical protein BUALT_Bualt06G0035000 [Buddleja alternifolia]|uniref:NB-ARC domain-containing protein n=1 Tax=Buddleja alternifolia TaxID=168488 RepID=A0AAV6XCN1_9LAMI|nr:hypothetical protein BUALT_Bualt06G0035000 [Buddleja alternifolia]
MAYAALVSLAQTLEQILKHDQHSIFCHEKRLLKSLHKNTVFLLAFLEDFSGKPNNVEGRITDAANEAEDIIECLIYEHIHSLKSCGGTQNANSSPFRNQHKFKKHYQKLPKINEDVVSIVEEVVKIKNSLLRFQDLQLNDSSPSSSPVINAPTKNDAMVGFDDDLLMIKTRLCGESSKLQVIPIFGMGGIGKTTLAKNAYDDPLTMQHFHIRAWVTVSQDYSVQEILFTLLFSIKEFKEVFDEEVHSYELMSERVYKSLKGRKYLIVMDDMWSTKAWDDVKRLFPDDNNGSRIMLTTRLSDVAAYADSSSPLHEMHCMNMVQSWNLLRKKVFKQECCPPELENIGRMIARSCRGLPLAIVVIAGLLSTISRTQDSWENIADNVSSAVQANDKQFAKILSLSYTHLPHHLRPCFLYMGGFPEDYEIHVSKLIKLWIAEGFLKPSVSKSFEEEAEEFLENLVKRSLVFIKRRKSNGKIKSCSVHDLVRDLCIRKGQEEKFLNVNKILSKSIRNQRRLSISRSSLTLLSNIYAPSVRTIFCFQHCQRLLSALEGFRLLRVLDAVKLIFRKFPPQLLELVLLRYLAFTFWHEGEFDLPASVSKFQNLQTLFMCPYMKKYENVRIRVRFPVEIWRMPQLRHLVLLKIDALPDPCARSSPLRNLQTLSVVKNFKCTERIMQMIPNLKKLGIVYDGDEKEWSDYHLDNLVHLHQLEKLNICVENRLRDRTPLWENLALPMMLKKLTLRSCLLSLQDMAIIGSLLNLEVLKLRYCSYEDSKWETSEEEFPKLKSLLIIGTNLQHWITESSHFPRLNRLMLCGCNKLDEIPNVIGEIPTLELIEVSRWNKCLVESAKRIKEEQQESGNESLQVRILI